MPVATNFQLLLFIIAEKAKARGEELKRCRCSVLRDKELDDGMSELRVVKPE